MQPTDINDALLAAHAAGDACRIATLYAQAAEQETDIAARAFLLTQAYIFALEAGSAQAARLRADLVALGAER